MTVNPYVNFFTATNEQSMIDSLIIESIKMYGTDIHYVVREGNRNGMLNEDEQIKFTTAFPIEMYIKSIDGYGGDGMFLSNFGIEVRHQAMFTVSITRWNQTSPTITTNEDLQRPREGDLVYFALDHKLMEIKRVNQYSMFYQMGALQCYDLTVEVFEYGSEQFSTGVPAIDAIAQDLSHSTVEHGSLVNNIPTFDPSFLLSDIEDGQFSDNEEYVQRSLTLLDFSKDDPFSEKF